MRLLSRLWVSAVIATVLAGSADAQKAGQFAGLSFDLKWSEVVTFRRQTGQVFTATNSHSIKAYVSSADRVFEVGGSQSSGVRSSSEISGDSVTALNQAKSIRDERQKAWTVSNGALTKIIKLPQGFRVITLTLKPDGATCSFATSDTPDPETGKVVLKSFSSGDMLEVVSRPTKSYSCTVVRGNIFGAMGDTP